MVQTSSVLLLPCILDVSSLTWPDWGIPGITLALENSISYSNMYIFVCVVTHINKCQKVPKVPREIIPAAYHSNQHREMFQ